MKTSTALTLFALVSSSLHPSEGAPNSLIAPRFGRLPTGAVRPFGWSLNQARVQAEGLAGHLRDFDSYVAGSIWVPGGSIEYSEMHESGPYWFNGMIALAFQLEDQRLIGQLREFLDFNLDNQQSDGWIGPDWNMTSPRLVWPRYLVLLGLIQYAEADPSQTERIVDAMHSFASLVHEIWSSNQQGQPSNGFNFDYQFVRWEELILSLQWLFDNFPRGKEAELLESMQMIRASGFDWKNKWYTDANFPKEAVTSLNMQTHGVNNAEALKSEALAYRFTGDEGDKQSTFDRLELLYKYHGRASGTFSADEHLAGLDPSRGTELCTVVEQIFSLAIIYQTFGNNSIADRVEKLAYNALPAALMPDWKSHQYDQEVNQIWAQEMNPPPWGNNGPDSNVFGFEPNYPCCTVNHPQAYPKFWANSFVTDSNGTSLIHAFLGPATFSGRLGSNNQVEVTVDTLYPFGSSLTYTVAARQAFDFKIRIPDWAQNGKSTISLNNGRATRLNVDASSFHVVKVPARATTFTVTLDMPTTIEARPNGAIAVHRGPLLYAIDLQFNDTVTPGQRSAQALNDVRRLYPNAPADFLTAFDNHTQAHTLLPTGEWRLAIDPASIRVIDKSADISELPFYAWAADSSPVRMTADACQIEWGLVKGTASSPPTSPNVCVGPKLRVNLIPFGTAKLRLGEIPTMQVV
ncbi:Non-reducing end beta-L-arabinofuranosidase-like GH127 middle domain-containing protein [Pleurotus pulmonarius]